MKARVATVLSLTGVIVAGSAAALVNNQVLRSTEPVATTELFVGASAATTTSTTLASEPSVATTIAATTLRVYDIDKVGRITMDTANGNLRLVEGKEFEGWVVTKLFQASSTTVEVRFANLLGTVIFTAELADGEVTTDVSVEGVEDTSSSVTPSTTPGGGTTGNTTSGGGTTRTTVKRSTTTSVDDHDDDSPSTTDDHGGGGGGGHGGDD